MEEQLSRPAAIRWLKRAVKAETKTDDQIREQLRQARDYRRSIKGNLES
eukprot:CAMPEP_0175877750 /NCGR_PEP_ID=MMETSP0107_2-20121207/40798_1 /TAXON_ID=195067 ORGANISM="Goniomonas pacifica, Strain CCMP1869" /NCGR_SAMPLE_ID=MMETSP0107_2 /ASSEMBLY_ACC=CAM_ASM_000203 /LENGTH=48 /DNA_ID= /DNA_START= /DNA_END= /DNA_ORIENTATION=